MYKDTGWSWNSLALLREHQVLIFLSLLALFSTAGAQPGVVFTALDLNEGVLQLGVDMALDAGLTVDCTRIGINSGANDPDNAHSLSSPVTITGSEVSCSLSVNLVTIIGTDPSFVPDIASNTFIYIESGTGIMAGGVELAPNLAGLQVTLVVADTTPPQIASFDLNLSTNELILTFNEAVAIATFDPSAVVIQSSSSNPDQSVTLTTQSMPQGSGAAAVVVIELNEDGNSLKVLSPLATSAASSYLSFTSGMVQDIWGIAIVAIDSSSAISVSNYIADDVSPEVVSFDLDLNTGVFILTFSEPVESSTFIPSRVLIQSSAIASGTSYQLSDQTTAQGSNAVTLPIVLAREDLNGLKLIDNLVTSETDTFLSCSEGMVTDTSGNPSVAIDSSNALQVNSYTPDIIRPVVISFDLDLTTEVLILTFSEPVQSASFMPSRVRIQPSGIASGTSYRLSDQTTTQSSNAVILVLNLALEDSNGLKLIDNLATSETDTFLSCSEGMVADTSGNPSVAIDSSNALQVNSYTHDTISPVVISFDLDLDGDVLILSFSEPVSIDSFRPSEIVISSSLNMAAESVQLSEQSVPQGSNSDRVVLQLNGDLQRIKANTLLATSFANTFLSFTADMVTDLNGNNIVPVLPSLALMVSIYTADRTIPILQSFILDFDSNQLIFNFTEPVLINAINSSALALSNSPLAPTVQVTGIQLATLSIDSNIVTATIAGEALCLIKANSAIGNDETDTFLSVQNGAILDTNYNPIANQTMAGIVVRDESSPSLVSFALDMNTGSIELTFNDVIHVDSQRVRDTVAIQRAPLDENPFLLTGGDVTGDGCTIVVIHLLQKDLNMLKTTQDLAASTNTTFLVINDTAFRDLNGNHINPIANGHALMVGRYREDVTDPILVAFDLDLNDGKMILTFDEPVNASSFNLVAFTFNLNQDDGSIFLYTLTGGAITSHDTDIPTILLSQDDLFQIKCSSSFTYTTHLQISPGAVLDMNGNHVVGASVPARNVTRDSSPPQLRAFEFDLDSGAIGLTFDEPVDPTTLFLSQISLQSTPIDMSNSLTLSGGNITNPISPVMLIHLTDNDINAVKVNPELAVNLNNTFISVGDGFVKDCAGISASSISAASALQASIYTTDATPPELLSYDLDLDEGTLTLYFDEPVSVASLDVSGITIQDAPSSPTTSLALTVLDQSLSGSNSLAVTIPISSNDLMALQNLQMTAGIAVSGTSSYLSITSSTITDLNGNPIIGISSDEAIVVSEFFPDVPDISQLIPHANFVVLSWSVPTGPMINNYTVTWERDATGECSDEDEGSTTLNDDLTSYIVTELEEDSDYTITVAGLSKTGSAVSDPVTITTLEAAPSAPPTSVRVSAATSSSIAVQWGAVDCIHRNGNITGFSVQYVEQGRNSIQTVYVSGGATTEAMISGLKSSTTYEIEVAAVNTAGTGVYSNSSTRETTGTSAETSETEQTVRIVSGAAAGAVALTIVVAAVVIMMVVCCARASRKENAEQNMMELQEPSESYPTEEKPTLAPGSVPKEDEVVANPNTGDQ